MYIMSTSENHREDDELDLEQINENLVQKKPSSSTGDQSSSIDEQSDSFISLDSELSLSDSDPDLGSSEDLSIADEPVIDLEKDEEVPDENKLKKDEDYLLTPSDDMFLDDEPSPEEDRITSERNSSREAIAAIPDDDSAVASNNLEDVIFNPEPITDTESVIEAEIVEEAEDQGRSSPRVLYHVPSTIPVGVPSTQSATKKLHTVASYPGPKAGPDKETAGLKLKTFFARHAGGMWGNMMNSLMGKQNPIEKEKSSFDEKKKSVEKEIEDGKKEMEKMANEREKMEKEVEKNMAGKKKAEKALEETVKEGKKAV